MRKLLLLSLLCGLPAFATLSSTVQFDVRTTGSDSNSGGFDIGVVSPGTDYSQQNSPQISYTDMIVGATTSKFTSVLNPVGSALPGNTFVITGGVGCTTGTYEVLSNATITATADRSLGTAASVCTAVLGGSFLTPGQAFSLVNATGQVVWLCGGCGTGTFTVTGITATGAFAKTLWGYGSTHGDQGTKPIIQSSQSGTPMLNVQYFTAVNNVEFLALSGFNSVAIAATGGSTNLMVMNSLLIGTAAGTNGAGIDTYNSNPNVQIFNTEIKGWQFGIFSPTGSSGSYSSTYWIVNCYIHNNVYGMTDGNTGGSVGFSWVSVGTVWDSNSYGIYVQNSSISVANLLILAQNSVFSNNTNDGVNNQSAYNNWGDQNIFQNTIFYGNGGYGVNLNAHGTGIGCPAFVSPKANLGDLAMNNGVGANTLGNYNCVQSQGTDIALSANPFTSSTNFALNSTSGGGAALKAAGFPGVAAFGTGSAAIGALQPAASAATSAAAHAYVQ
jgi:hypothetical protein